MQESSSLSVTQGHRNSRDHMSRFMYALKSQETRRQYPQRLKIFLDFIGLHSDSLEEEASQFLDKVSQNPRWFEDLFMDFIDFQLGRVRKGEISESTIRNYYKATKLFCEMNDVSTSINWKRISRGLPRGKQAANDRAPTREEIQTS